MNKPVQSPRAHREGDAPIRLRIQHINQLFHTLDPFPFRDKDLDAQVEEYIVGRARVLGASAPLTISIHLPAHQANAEGVAQIAEGIRNYFGARTEALSLDLRTLFRSGRNALAIGLPVLAATIVLGSLLPPALPAAFARRFVEEGLIILGWVANWKSFEIFLFEWWPIVRKRDLYRRLTEARVEVVPDPDAPAPAS